MMGSVRRLALSPANAALVGPSKRQRRLAALHARSSPSGGQAMVSRRVEAATIVRVSVVSCIFTFSIGVGQAADLSVGTAPAASPEVSPHWFVRFGGLGVISESSSKLYVQQQTVGIIGVGPQMLVPGRS